MSETKRTPETDAVMRGMAKKLAEQFFAFQRARPKVEELVALADEWEKWTGKHDILLKFIAKIRALESALGGKAE